MVAVSLLNSGVAASAEGWGEEASDADSGGLEADGELPCSPEQPDIVAIAAIAKATADADTKRAPGTFILADTGKCFAVFFYHARFHKPRKAR